MQPWSLSFKLFHPFQFELRTAIELGKKIILVHETEGAHGKFDFASEKAAAPDDLRAVLDGAPESIHLCSET